MNTPELIGLLGTGPNAAVMAAVADDPSWNVASDWGFGDEWRAARAPTGVRFQRYARGLVSEAVLIAGGARADDQRILSQARVPVRLVLVDRPHRPHNRLAPLFLSHDANGDC